MSIRTILNAGLESVGDSHVHMDMRLQLLLGVCIATGTPSSIRVGIGKEMIDNDGGIPLAAFSGGSHMQAGSYEESIRSSCAMFVPGGWVGANVTRSGFTYVKLRFDRKSL